MSPKSLRILSLLFLSVSLFVNACGRDGDDPLPYEPNGDEEIDNNNEENQDDPLYVVCEGAGADEEGCVSSVRWEAGPAAPERVDHHATDLHVVDGGARLVIAGGAQDSGAQIFDSIWGLRLTADGEVDSQWESIGTLPRRLGAPTLNFYDGYVYVTGGRTSISTQRATYVAAVDEAGQIGDFTATTSLPTAVWHHQAFTREGYLYVVGGAAGHEVSYEGVYRAQMLGSGGLGQWEEMESMPVALSHQGFAYGEDKIFLVGGLLNHVYEDRVLGATFNADGSLSWAELEPLPQALVTPSAAVIGNGLYVVGGLTGSNDFVGNVYRAIIDEDGSLRDWQEIDRALPGGRAHVHQMPTFNGRLYTVGGRTSGLGFPSIDDVHVGILE